MVAAGIGITVMPMSAVQALEHQSKLLAYVPFERPVPERRVVLAWRKSFPRVVAVQALTEAVFNCGLKGVKMLNKLAATQLF